MIDWLSSMSQTYEFYEVDPGTWKDKRQIKTITSAKISRDLESNTQKQHHSALQKCLANVI